MCPDQVSNSGPLALESDVLPTAICGPGSLKVKHLLFISSIKRPVFDEFPFLKSKPGVTKVVPLVNMEKKKKNTFVYPYAYSKILSYLNCMSHYHMCYIFVPPDACIP